MTKPAKYVFGGISFTAKKAVEKHARVICSRYPRNATISATEDIAFLRELLACNVEADEKQAGQIKRFYWAKSPDHPTDCLWIERIVGVPTEFGVPACLNKIGSLNRSALRAAVRPEIDAFRAHRLATAGTHFKSDFSGQIFPVSDAEADHVPPFVEIVNSFFEPLGINVENYMLTLPQDAKSEPVWRDPALIASFREYHKGCTLRLVQRHENQSAIRRENSLAEKSAPNGRSVSDSTTKGPL